MRSSQETPLATFWALGPRRSCGPQRNGDLATMHLLLAKSANSALATQDHTTALMAAVGGLGRKYGEDLHVTPQEEENAIRIAMLLLERGADINAANDAG